ncbi:MAG: diguanylate cyclase domain-containing protein [Ignavibacteria bacterium]
MLPAKLRRLTSSLVFRLIAFGILLVALSQSVRLTLIADRLQKDVQEVVAAQQFSLATYVARDIDGKIRLRQQLLEALAKDLQPELLQHPALLEAWLGRRHSANPLFSLGIMVIPAGGKGILADFPTVAERRRVDFAAVEWFRKVHEQRSFVIGKPTIGRATGQPVVVMATPRFDARGRLVAVVAGATALDAPGFLDLVQNNPIGKSGGFLLVSPRDNLFVAASSPDMRLKPLPAPGLNALHDQAMQGFRGTGITVNAFGVENLASFVSVPAADWFLVARLPTSEAFQPIREIRSGYLQGSLLIALGVVVLLVIFLNYTFRPLKNAARQMRRMADGIEPLAPLPVARQDEVGEMAEGFNYLLEKLRDSEARMAHLAHHDALTGLPNRLSFLAQMQHGAAVARRRENRLALLFLDLDGFKPINDRHGHETGDRLLRQVAVRLGEAVRESDAVARFGGDEFVLLLTDVDRDSAAAVAEKVIARVSAPYLVEGVQLTIGTSIGIALFPDDADDVTALIAQADAAMYDAKRGGRGCYRFAHRHD